MERFGLRNHAGPFDWYFSDFEPVLKVMEADFADFMAKENLLTDKNDSKVFYDKKYGFCYNHDVNCDLETEYPLIYQKYMRRVRRFRCDVQSPTCFIRAVRSEEEIRFIKENGDYIRRIIKRGNCENEVVFLLLSDMESLSEDCDFLWFRLGIKKYVGRRYEMRTMFESSSAFSKFCKESILSNDDMIHNIEYDRQHSSIEDKLSVFINRLSKENYNMIPVLEEYYPDIGRGIYLWGMGAYGVSMLQYLLRNGVKVKGIIDNDSKKIGTFYENIPVIALSEMKICSQNILISIESEQQIDEIMKQVSKRDMDITIYKLADFLDHPLILPVL